MKVSMSGKSIGMIIHIKDGITTIELYDNLKEYGPEAMARGNLDMGVFPWAPLPEILELKDLMKDAGLGDVEDEIAKAEWFKNYTE